MPKHVVSKLCRAAVAGATLLIGAIGCAGDRAPADLSMIPPERLERAREASVNVEGKERLAIEGYDPVAYFSDGPVEGKAELAATHEGATYRFAIAANRAAFVSDPDRYAPAYGGWCATAMAGSGNKVDVCPENYRVDDGRLYLFYKFLVIDARPSWASDAAGSRERADANWARLLAGAAQADGEGR